MTEPRIPYGHVFFQNFLPGGVATLRNGVCVLIVGAGSDKHRELRVPKTLLCDVALERFQRWREDGGDVPEEFYESVQSGDILVRTPDVLYMSPYPALFQCSKCGLVDTPLKGSRPKLVRVLAQCVTGGSSPRLPCAFCGARLRQLPFVQIHKCGHLAPIEVPRIARYHRVRFHDKGTFRRSTWTNFETGENLGSAFQGFCPDCSYGGAVGDKDQQRIPMAATRLRGGRGESFYPLLARFIAFSPETTRILTSFRALRSSAVDLGRAILCGLLDLQEPHQLRINLDSAAQTFATAATTDTRENRRYRLHDSIKLLREMQMEDAAKGLEQELRSMQEAAPQSSGLFEVADKFIADVGVLFQLGSHHRAAEAALIREEFTELPQDNDPGKSALADQLLADDRQKILLELYGVREFRHIQDVDTVIAAIGFSRQLAWPHGKDSSHPPRLNPFTDELDPTLPGKIPFYAAPIRTEAILLRLDPCRVLRWAIDTLAWPQPADRTILSDARRAHAAILRMAPALATTPTEIQRLAAQGAPGGRYAAHLLGLLHSLVHCALRTARSGSGYEMTSLDEVLFPADMSGLILVGSRKSFTTGGLRTLCKHKLTMWFAEAAKQSLRCILDPQCSQQRGASCNACLQLPMACETFNRGISRAYLAGGDVPDVDGGTLLVERGFWA